MTLGVIADEQRRRSLNSCSHFALGCDAEAELLAERVEVSDERGRGVW